MNQMFNQTIGCPDHPDAGMLAFERSHRVVPCRIHLIDGSLEIEIDTSAVFVHDMETSIIIAYKCAIDSCAYTLQPEEIQHEVAIRMEEHADKETFGGAEVVDSPATATALKEMRDERYARFDPVVQGKNESNADFNRRKAEHSRTQLEVRHRKTDSTASEDPLTKFGRVFDQ